VRVLIVDDDAALRSMTTALLQRDGFETITVGHGSAAVEAVDRAGAADYAAIVVQVNVKPSPIDAGEPTGMALLRHMQETKPHLVARTVVITTMPRLEVAACAALVQPFDIGALLEAIRRCVGRS
jgi:DNA-binding response OmpR family regulator